LPKKLKQKKKSESIQGANMDIKLNSKKKIKFVNSFIDTGTPLTLFSDIITSYAPFITIIKLGFGTSLLYTEEQLKYKIQKAKEHGVLICPGGTLFEIINQSNKNDEYINWVCRNGFNAIEFSTGVYDIPDALINDSINKALDRQLKVLVEIGKKSPIEDDKISPEERVSKANLLIKLGCYKVIMESRESGTLGIYNAKGEIKTDLLDYIIKNVDRECILFESPHKSQQAHLINLLGPEVGLANLAFSDVLSVMSLRYSLRADTINS
jgi:phosphosulfolactate synthase